MNGYPLLLVHGDINKSWEKETIKTILREHPLPEHDQKKSAYHDILRAQYIQGFTENLQMKLRRFHVGMVHKWGHNKANDLSHKTKGPKDTTKKK